MMMVAPPRTLHRRHPSSTSSDVVSISSPSSYHLAFTTPSRQRVCDSCYSDIQQFLAVQRASIVHQTRRNNSNIETSSITSTKSMMLECPVCAIRLDQLGSRELREEHLRECFEHLESHGAHITSVRYAGK